MFWYKIKKFLAKNSRLKSVFNKNSSLKEFFNKNSSLSKGFLRAKNSKIKSFQLISFDKLLFVRLVNLNLKDENLEELIFEKACEELGLQQGFDYSFSYVLDKNSAFVFLTKDENLDKNCEFCLAEPLLFSLLNALKGSKINHSYAVLVLEENYAYLALFNEARLLILKNLPQFNTRHLKDRDETSLQGFLEERLILVLKTVCKEDQVLFLVCEDLKIKEFLSSKLPCISLKKEDLRLEGLDLEECINFKRYKVETKLIKKFTVAFILSLSAGFILSFLSVFLEKDLNQNDSYFDSFNMKTYKDDPVIAEKRTRVLFIQNELRAFFLTQSLKELFARLYEEKARLVGLEFKDEEFKILIHKNTQGDNFLKKIYQDELFSLKHKEVTDDFYELSLELKDD